MMVDFDMEFEVRGPYAAQPLLVKIGCWVLCYAFVVFGLFVPSSLVVAVIMGVGGPAANWQGTAGAIAFCCVYAAIGAWVSCQMVSWLRSGNNDFRGHILFLAATILIFTVISALAASIGVWQELFLSAGASVLLGIVLASILIAVGQTFGGKR
jgi:hypothetical protein